MPAATRDALWNEVAAILKRRKNAVQEKSYFMTKAPRSKNV